jgi:hypothetical protein
VAFSAELASGDFDRVELGAQPGGGFTVTHRGGLVTAWSRSAQEFADPGWLPSTAINSTSPAALEFMWL